MKPPASRGVPASVSTFRTYVVPKYDIELNLMKADYPSDVTVS